MPVGKAREEFEAVFAAESDRLFRFCYSRTTDRELAIELSQEAFARLWGEMAGGGTVPNPPAFLFLVAKRLIIDWYRRKKSLSLESLAIDPERPFEPKDESAVGHMETDSDGRRLLALIDKLDDRYRDIVYLRFVEDWPPREIAAKLNLGANVVSVRLTRGLEALRKLAGIDLSKLI